MTPPPPLPPWPDFLLPTFFFLLSLFFSFFLFFFLLFGFHLTELFFFSPILLVLSQVRGSFLSPFFLLSHGHVSSHGPCIICHVSHGPCFRCHHPHHMALMPCILLPWFHVAALCYAMWHHPMCHLTSNTSKNVKF